MNRKVKDLLERLLDAIEWGDPKLTEKYVAALRDYMAKEDM